MSPWSTMTKMSLSFCLILCDMTSIKTAKFIVAPGRRESFGLRGNSGFSANAWQRNALSSFFSSDVSGQSLILLLIILEMAIDVGALGPDEGGITSCD